MSKELKVARAATQAAARVLKKYFGKKLRYTFKHGLNDQLVSAADRAAERAALAVIRRAFPKDNIYSEEAGRLQGNSGQRWWLLDPLDGSRIFVHGLPFWGVMAGLWTGSDLALSVVQLPHLKKEVIALKGKGVRINNRRVRVSDVSTLARAFGTVGGQTFPVSHNRAWLKIVTGLRKVVKLRNLGCISFEHAMMASGSFDYAISVGPEMHDGAISAFLVEEAGGKVTDLKGRPWQKMFKIGRPTSGIMVATNGHLHGELVELVRKQLLK